MLSLRWQKVKNWLAIFWVGRLAKEQVWIWVHETLDIYSAKFHKQLTSWVLGHTHAHTPSVLMCTHAYTKGRGGPGNTYTLSVQKSVDGIAKSIKTELWNPPWVTSWGVVVLEVRAKCRKSILWSRVLLSERLKVWVRKSQRICHWLWQYEDHFRWVALVKYWQGKVDCSKFKWD